MNTTRRRHAKHHGQLPGLLLCLLTSTISCKELGPLGEDRELFTEALQLMKQEPRQGFQLCRAIDDGDLRSECGLAGVEAIAAFHDEPTSSLLSRCHSLDSDMAVQECAFQVAEARNDPEACSNAGRFEPDCRLHLLSGSFKSWVEKGTRASDPDLHRQMEQKCLDVGLQPDDLRAWSALFRWVLGSSLPLDRAVCREITRPDRSDACWQTGRALYEDRLNQARDTRSYPCDGGPLPQDLLTTPDPQLESIRNRRVHQDICP